MRHGSLHQVERSCFITIILSFNSSKANQAWCQMGLRHIVVFRKTSIKKPLKVIMKTVKRGCFVSVKKSKVLSRTSFKKDFMFLGKTSSTAYKSPVMSLPHPRRRMRQRPPPQLHRQLRSLIIRGQLLHTLG